MKGIHVINDPNGNPAVLTIDLHHLDPDVSPLVLGLLDRLAQQSEEQERREFLDASGLLANRAFGDDEPEYTVADLKWINPNFSPNAIY